MHCVIRDLLLPGITLQLQIVQLSDLRTWDWKLDPWRKASVADSVSAFETVVVKAVENPLPLPEPLVLLQKEKTGFFEHRIYRLPDAGILWQLVRIVEDRPYLNFRVNSGWNEITLTEDHTGTLGSAAFEYLAQILPGVFLKNSTLTFHGVLMEHKGRGIIISAPSGMGKTTHARLWRDNKRAIIINGDRATCQKVDGVWTGFGLPWSGTSGEQINRSVPITALVVLERGEQNEAHRISGLESFGAVWPHVQYPNWDEALTGKALELTDDFLSQIPIIRLHCRPDVDSVEVLNRALEEL